MVKIDLVTGFLGSGKTTFIKRYAEYLMDQGQNIGILENDFGAVNVDMLLLQELQGDNCELEMISGGCDQETHRRRFKTKLISMGMCGYDRVIVEPSGIYDVDEFFDVLRDDPLDRWYEIGNVFAVVNAKLENQLSDQAEFLLASETANAGRVILSRSQEAAEEEKRETVEHLNRAMAAYGCSRKLEPSEILDQAWDEFTKEDFQKILNSGYRTESYRKPEFNEKQGFQSLYYMNLKMTEAEVKTEVQAALEDEKCGSVFRIKGFMQTGENQWIELNATKNETEIHPIREGQEVLIVIGERLEEEALAAYFGYPAK
nr:GTP-binding protein [uncultured Mediterraneibacter sp.]